jgi:hypothetical protein
MSDDGTEKKRLRSSDPDLQIILGSGANTSTQSYHSQSLALKSKYIDTMLSTPMRGEQNRLTITFPDICPAVWEKMISFIDDPLAARSMKAEDVRDVAVFYDKYEFTLGCKLCDQVLMDYLSSESLKKLEQAYELDLDLIIDLTEVAHNANLSKAFERGISYLGGKLRGGIYWSLPGTPYDRVMFTEEHVSRIFPLLKHCPLPNDYITSISFHLNCANMNREEMFEQPGIEKVYVSSSHQQLQYRLLRKCISHIELTGSTCNADGIFEREEYECYTYEGGDRTATWGRERVKFAILIMDREMGGKKEEG